MKILFASLKHQVRVFPMQKVLDNLRVDTPEMAPEEMTGVKELSIDAGCLIINRRKAIPLAHVLEMDVEAGKR